MLMVGVVYREHSILMTWQAAVLAREPWGTHCRPLAVPARMPVHALCGQGCRGLWWQEQGLGILFCTIRCPSLFSQQPMAPVTKMPSTASCNRVGYAVYQPTPTRTMPGRFSLPTCTVCCRLPQLRRRVPTNPIRRSGHRRGTI